MARADVAIVPPGEVRVIPYARVDPPAAAAPAARVGRLASVDAYRGLVMFLMMAEVLRLARVARATGGRLWAFLAYHQSHAEWVGCSLHDLIQPSFSFLVGVALPFSIASRRARGQSVARMTAHALWRSLVLVALGVFLRSVNRPQTNFTFEDTLSQIGLGYALLFALGLLPARAQWVALGLILVGYWAAFALYPAPAVASYGLASRGVPDAWLRDHALAGFAAHWTKNANLAWRFDTWFLNLFPRPTPFAFNAGGYATLSFVPTLGTMLLGLIAGNLLRSARSHGDKVGQLLAAGVASLAIGWLLGRLGICPVVKRIWTPSWVLFSGGWCFLLLASFYLIMDVGRLRRWAFPLVVIGTNSIAAYVMAHLFEGFIVEALRRHVRAGFFTALGPAYEPLVLGACVLLVLWSMLYWMHRRGLFLRV